MFSARFLAFILACVAMITTPALGQDKPDYDHAEKLLRETESRFDSVQSLQYTVAKTTHMNRRTVIERWTQRYQQPNLLRVDYLLPVERLLVMSNNDIWEYIPEARKAVYTRLDKLTDEKRAAFIASVLGRVSIDGLRPGNYREMLQRVVRVQPVRTNGDIYVIEGRDPKFIVEIDASRQALLRTEVYDTKGNLKIRTAASELSEIVPGFWFPEKIRATYWNDDAYIVSDFVLTDVRVNEQIPPDTFKFEPRPGILVRKN
jgi:outer membrane lipoprotein-sorting protein